VRRLADLAKREARDGLAPYGSSMCSIPGGGPAALSPAGGTGQPDPVSEPAELGRPGERGGHGEADRLGWAIDELATAARATDATAQDVATRLARVWEMVADLDPELARRLAGYDL